MEQIRVYFNDIDTSSYPILIKAGCKYTYVKRELAINFADRMIEIKNWRSYIIPELTTSEIVYEEQRFKICVCTDPLEQSVFKYFLDQVDNKLKSIKTFTFDSQNELNIFLEGLKLSNCFDENSYKIFEI